MLWLYAAKHGMETSSDGSTKWRRSSGKFDISVNERVDPMTPLL